MSLLNTLSAELDQMGKAGTLKRELPLRGPQGAMVEIEGKGEVIMLTSNNYLGLANHPAIVEAAEKAERDYGYGLASVRFICGTQTIHRRLEERISEFFGTEETILYGSCWNANEGLFQTITTEDDTIVSDELNHASIIDGVRLAKSHKERYKNRDMADLRRVMEETKDSRNRVIMTDGVFSMEGSLAPLPEMVAIAREHGAFLVVDDSHGTGVLGKTGRGTAEELGVFGKIDAYTSTLGKALGGSHGGFTTGPRVLVDYLRQKSRPYLFSNTLPPAVVMGSMAALDLLQKDSSSGVAAAGEHDSLSARPHGAGREHPRRNHADRADPDRRHGQGDRHVGRASRPWRVTSPVSAFRSFRRGRRGCDARSVPRTRASSSIAPSTPSWRWRRSTECSRDS